MRIKGLDHLVFDFNSSSSYSLNINIDINKLKFKLKLKHIYIYIYTIGREFEPFSPPKSCLFGLETPPAALKRGAESR